MFDLIAREYRAQNLTTRQLAQLVKAGFITLDEAKLIVATGGNVGAFAEPAQQVAPEPAPRTEDDAPASTA
ncbi:hypothetical protein ACFFKU_06820 [Kineococcus gynurae]|uniref:XkdX family protein n=1 Tax=Kineococcus gynurae TaxID=452979 RepID=A0ABV5LWY6_9ACTN